MILFIEGFGRTGFDLLILFKVSNRRDGDVSVSYSDPSFAKLAFNWEAKYNLEDMCNDAWNFKLNNIS